MDRREYLRQWWLDHPEARERQSIRERVRRLNRRRQVIAAYGGQCACCGETTTEFLAVDHINGGGAAHRTSVSGHLYLELERLGYPSDGYRLLCHNCNQALGLYWVLSSRSPSRSASRSGVTTTPSAVGSQVFCLY